MVTSLVVVDPSLVLLSQRKCWQLQLQMHFSWLLIVWSWKFFFLLTHQNAPLFCPKSGLFYLYFNITTREKNAGVFSSNKALCRDVSSSWNPRAGFDCFPKKMHDTLYMQLSNFKSFVTFNTAEFCTPCRQLYDLIILET